MPDGVGVASGVGAAGASGVGVGVGVAGGSLVRITVGTICAKDSAIGLAVGLGASFSSTLPPQLAAMNPLRVNMNNQNDVARMGRIITDWTETRDRISAPYVETGYLDLPVHTGEYGRPPCHRAGPVLKAAAVGA